MKLESGGVEMKLSTTEYGVSVIAGRDTFPIGIKGLVMMLMVFRGMSEKENLNAHTVLEHKYSDRESYYQLCFELRVYKIKQWEAFALMIAAEQLIGEVVLCS